MSIGNLLLGVNKVTVSDLIHYDCLLQNATAILLQNATAILLQNATEVHYKMRQVFYYKMRQFCYKMRQLLQQCAHGYPNKLPQGKEIKEPSFSKVAKLNFSLYFCF